MSILLFQSERIYSDSLAHRFSCFDTDCCNLPTSIFYTHDLSEIAGFLSKNPAFSVCFCGNNQFKKSLPNEIVIGDFHFASCGDGVVIYTNESIWVWVHDNWKRIDAFMQPPMHRSPNLPILLMRAYQFTALYSGNLIVHAAAVSYNDQGIVFCGVPGAGKSTQARLWESVFHAEAINNDQPCIFFRERIAYVNGTPWSGKEPCYKDLYVPVRALVFVQQSKEDRIERLTKREAYGLVYLNQYVPPVREDTELIYFDAVERFVNTIPIYRQYCTDTVSAPKALYNYLFEFEGEKTNGV